MKCPECEATNDVMFDLAAMHVNRLEIKPITPGQNLFEMVLPQTGAKVQWRFLTGGDETDMMRAAEQKKKARAAGADSLVTDRLLRAIVSINGVTDRNKLAQVIPYLPSPDSRAFREHLDKHEPGVEMKADFACDFCEYAEEVDVPIDAGFFWPSTK